MEFSGFSFNCAFTWSKAVLKITLEEENEEAQLYEAWDI